jgi:acyl-CoA synthetase (AMP-forming)/AMP-acid ligase II
MLAETIAIHARTRPTHPALLDAEGRMLLDHAGLDAAVNRMAHLLRMHGVAEGRLVALSLADTALHLLALFACARLGAPVLPMDWRWTKAERARLRDAFRPALILAEPSCADGGQGETIADAGFEAALAAAPATAPPPPADPDPPMVVALSSGTTGAPKGPMIRQSHMRARFLGHYVGLGFARTDRFLCATPLYHGGGRGFAMSILFAGGTLMLHPPPWEPAALARAIARHGVTTTFLVPTMLRRGQAAAPAGGPWWPGLRALVSTGAALAPAERRAVRERLSPRLFDYYGSTEGGGATVLPPEEMDGHGDTVGRAAFGIELDVVDAAGQAVPPGTEGSIRWRGPTLPAEMPGDPAFRDGWFFPGDRGVLDAAGYLRVTGRDAELIIRGGVNIHPAEIEAALRSIPGVQDAAVLGLPDPEFGEAVAAVLVAPGLSDASLRAAMAGLLAPYKRPTRLLMLADLPRNAGGKVVKAALRGMFGA